MKMQYWVVAIGRAGSGQPALMEFGPYDDEAEALGDCNQSPDDPRIAHSYVVGEEVA